MDLRGKTVLMTGASGGIGRALAEELAKRNVSLLLFVRRADTQLREDLRQAGSPSVEFVEVDLADPAALETAISLLSDRPIDVLINNAGLLTGGLLEEQSPAEIQRMFQVNLLSAVRLTRALLSGMIHRKTGLIVNNASVSGRMFLPCATTYAASKAGLVAFTECLRKELRGTAVRTLLLITPGIKTQMFDRIDALYGNHLKLPLSSITANEYARLVVQKMESGEETLVPGGVTGFILNLARYFPGAFERWVDHYFSRD